MSVNPDDRSLDDLRALIRSIPDFPEPGILFRDITTLLSHGEGLALAVRLMSERVLASGVAAVAGIEARGFIFGAAVAARAGLGFIPVRKPGKLPVPALAIDYALEYGTGVLEIDPGAIAPGMAIAVIDDLIATGGTAEAAVRLLRQAGASVDLALFLIDLPDLGGADRLRAQGVAVDALMAFPGH